MSALEEPQRLEERLAHIERMLEDLAQRVQSIERTRGASVASPSTVPESPKEALSAEPGIPPPPVVPPLSEEAAARVTPMEREEPLPPAPPPVMASLRAQPSGEEENWEQLVGGRMALWLGSIATFLALGFFLAYAWRYFSDAGRLAVGFAGGALLLALGEYASKRVERWFSEGISGAGIAVLYLSIWAGAQRYGSFSFELSFVLMALTVALGVVLALRHDAISLGVLATLGGFLTPVLLGTGEGRGTPYPFLTYVTVLNAGILVVSLYRNWWALVWLSFTATVLLLLGWAAEGYEPVYRWQVFAFVSVNFALYLAAACVRCFVRRTESLLEETLLVIADAGVYAPAGYVLIGDALGRFPGAFALVLAILFGGMSAAVQRTRRANHSLRVSLGWLAFLFLMWAVTHQTHESVRHWFGTGDWQRLAQLIISLEWTLVGALLLVAGVVRSVPSMRMAAFFVLGAAALKVFLYDLSFLDTPMRILSFGGLGLTLIGISWLYSRYGTGTQSQQGEAKPA